MNLYRSFGNLMEAWVTEGAQGLDSEWLGVNEDSSSPSSNPRSESVDSGVETASSETSFPALDASTSPVLSSPVLSSSSSSSPHLRPSRTQDILSQKLERALQRADSKRLKEISELPTVDEVPRLRPKRHTSHVVRGQRSESLGPRTLDQSAPKRQMSEMCKRPMSTSYDMRRAETSSEVPGDEKRKDLSPGLCYLEQVCQMLEEIARQQMHSQALQMEMDALREHGDMEVSQPLDVSQSDSGAAAGEEPLCRQKPGNTNRADCSPQQRKENPYRHFRQRSASDPTIALLHLRMLNTDSRGQHLNRTDGLQEDEDEDDKKQVEYSH
ncbi:uncharacterized protein LOC141805794 [Halichoeres trimaculatus]|uniref:uncharacterized protein LOC141805794 n=1 Tax=Halichoeres trimaculatus TaxID=147232 RepID=UPI003D9EDC5F